MAIQKIDVLGMSSLIAYLTLLIVALNIGGDAYPWASKIIIGLFVGSGCAFCSFVAAENFATFPVVPMGLFASLKWRNVPIMTSKSNLQTEIALPYDDSRPVFTIFPPLRHGESCKMLRVLFFSSVLIRSDFLCSK